MKALVLSFLIFLLSFSVHAFEIGGNAKGTKEMKGAKDHSLITRFPGSFIRGYGQKDFDEFGFLSGPYSKTKKAVPRKNVEGKVTRILYGVPKGKSAFEVYTNISEALKSAGLQVVFEGKGGQLGDANHFASAEHNYRYGTTNKGKKEVRYLFGTLSHKGRRTWVSALVAPALHSTLVKSKMYAHINIVEEKEMKRGQVSVDAKAMEEAINTHGKIALYGIHFDTNSAKIQSKSKPMLAEIGKYMKRNPQVKIFVVGHTDSTGKLKHNMELSKKRAASVVASLAKSHGVKKSRMTPYGIGPLAPVSTNSNDTGRAKNRRVELVKK